MQNRIGQQKNKTGIYSRFLESAQVLPFRIKDKCIYRIEKRHEKDLEYDPSRISANGNRMLLSPIIHDDTADNHNQHTCQNDQARKYEKLKFRNSIPAGRAERLIDVDKNQRKEGCHQNETNNIRLFINIFRYPITSHSHTFYLCFGNKCTYISLHIHPAYKYFTPLSGFLPPTQVAGTIYFEGLFFCC